MSISSKARACAVSGCAAVSLLAFSASARAEVLFDSLDSPNTGFIARVGAFTPADASFATATSAFHPTDVALLLSQLFGPPTPGDDFTVSLEGGVPLANIKEVVIDGLDLGLNVDPQGPVLASVTLPISDLSTSLTVEHFHQFASIALKPDSFYWIDVNTSTQAQNENLPVGVEWGVTSDLSGPGLSAGYNSSDATNLSFYPNIPFVGQEAFQMEISDAVPEPSTWGLMLMGFGGLGLIAYRRRTSLAFKAA